jgi:hypothetical protein
LLLLEGDNMVERFGSFVVLISAVVVFTGVGVICWAHGDECETFGGVCSDDKPADGDSTSLGQPIAADDPNAASQYVLKGGQWPNQAARDHQSRSPTASKTCSMAA